MKVYQALHGYADGHREISASVQLKPRDSKTVLVLSDTSGSGNRIAETGYVTGYPLAESGYYAIARTWSAPEMSRPGCVWTHTLFVDFADLADLRSAQELLPLFRRPTSGAVYGYDIPLLSAPVRDDMLHLDDLSTPWTHQLLSALYGRPRERIIISAPCEFDPEPIILAVWAQQWPRLRRSFCFCTSTTSDRSNERVSFDLQLLPSIERGARGRVQGVKDVDDLPSAFNEWILHAANDLASLNRDSLREFFRRVGGDISGGRHAFSSLIRLHKLLEEIESEPGLVDDAIRVLDDGLFDSGAASARAIVSGRAARYAGSLSDVALEFLACNISLVDDNDLDVHALAIGRAIWTRNTAIFSSILSSDAGQVVAVRTFDSLTPLEIVYGIRRASNLLFFALGRRPDVVSEPYLWESGGAVREKAFLFLQRSPELLRDAMGAMISSGSAELARTLFDSFGADPIWQSLAPIMDAMPGSEFHLLRPWLEVAVSDRGAVAKMLAEGRLRERRSLAAIARMTKPDNVLNDYGEDPWLLAEKGSVGTIPRSDEVYLMSYLLSRALGSSSRNSGDLIAISFDTVYRAALDNSIRSDAWGLLQYRLPSSGFWEHWDRCRQLSQGVADIFVYRNLSPISFGKLSSDDNAFAVLVRTAARNRRGRSFLKEVRLSLLKTDSQKFSQRIGLINRVLD